MIYSRITYADGTRGRQNFANSCGKDFILSTLRTLHNRKPVRSVLVAWETSEGWRGAFLTPKHFLPTSTQEN